MPLAASQLRMGAESMATLEWLSRKLNTSPFPGMQKGFWSQQTPDHAQQASIQIKSFTSAKSRNTRRKSLRTDIPWSWKLSLQDDCKVTRPRMACRSGERDDGIQPLVRKGINDSPSRRRRKPWPHGCNGTDLIETPAAHFARGDKYERQLLKVGQAKTRTCNLPSLSWLSKHPENLNLLFCEWETKPKADQTFVNIRGFVQKEFGKHNKQNKTTAKSVGHGIANC